MDNEDCADELAVGDRLARELCHGLPDAMELLREHEEDQDDEILATLFLDAVADCYTEAWLAREADPDAFADVHQLIVRIDTRFAAGSEIEQAMIVTGFLEGLPNAGDWGRGVVVTLPPRLRQERARMDAPRS